MLATENYLATNDQLTNELARMFEDKFSKISKTKTWSHFHTYPISRLLCEYLHQYLKLHNSSIVN